MRRGREERGEGKDGEGRGVILTFSSMRMEGELTISWSFMVLVR